MARKKNLVPSYLLHPQRGKARAVWTDALGICRFRMMPGAFNSPTSKAAFARLLLELAASPAASAGGSGNISVNEVLVAYLEHAVRHYRGPDGKPTSEIYEVRIVVRAIRLYGEKPVEDFGPLCVKAVRQ